MLFALLLQTPPTLHPLVTTLFSALLAGLATWLWTSRSERRAAKTKAVEAEEKRLRDVAEAARQAEADKRDWEDYCRRMAAAEEKIKSFVGEAKLGEQFSDLRERLRKQGAHLVTLQTSQHEANGRYDELKSDVRRNEAAITQLNALTPRVTKTESDILLLLQQMQQLKEGQNEIKTRLDKVADESHADRETILEAIRDLKP